ncbi:MAG: hypothetical protein IJ773_13745 [Lachnospiraceae bacterium]|nr:hypothetical protein [Lachnospiraceae bacterium]
MKTSDEMVQSLLERREKYLHEQAETRLRRMRILKPVATLGLAVLVFFGCWKGGIIRFGEDAPDTLYVPKEYITGGEGSFITTGGEAGFATTGGEGGFTTAGGSESGSLLTGGIPILSLSGCIPRPAGNTGEQEPALSNEAPIEPEALTEVADRDGKHLGQIDSRANCTAVENGIFYSVLALTDYSMSGTAQFHFFRPDDGTDTLLGTLPDMNYEASYARREFNGVVYTLAVTGNLFDAEADPLWLLAFDCKKGTMKKLLVTDSGFPYTAMAVVNGKLLIMSHDMPKTGPGKQEPQTDRVYAFDPVSGEIHAILSFPVEDPGSPAKRKESDSLRSLCADGDGFCLLRLHIYEDQHTELFLDRYGRDCRKLSEESLKDPLYKAAANELLPEDVEDDLATHTGVFALASGRYLFYESFGITRALVDLETKEILFDKGGDYALSVGSGIPAIYRIDYGDPDVNQTPSGAFILRDGALELLPFSFLDSGSMVRSVSRSATGTWVLRTAEARVDGSAPDVVYWWTEEE